MGYKPGSGAGAVGPVGPAAGSLQALTPLAINGDNAVHPTSGALVASFVPYTDPVFYVDPVGGNDTNAGTIGAPFATLNKALTMLAPGYYGWAQINLRTGNTVISNKTVFPGPLGSSSATAGGVLINGVDNTDSGLGARTANGGTLGVLATFGTCIDSVGGLVVNAYQGQFIRFTSGATLNGRSFLIVSNTATTFTIAGVFPVAPTTETFVVERPAAVLSWAGTEVMQADGVVGFSNIAFSGPGGANALRLSGGIFGTQRCTFATLGTGGIQLRGRCQFQDLFALQGYLGALSITQQCGNFFNATPISIAPSSATGLGPTGMNFNRSLLIDSNSEINGQCTVQFLGSQFQGNSYIRGVNGASILMGQNRFEAVTPCNAFATAFIGAFGAALVASKNSEAGLFNCVFNNTPATFGAGDAVLIEDCSCGSFTNITGAGNAGLGARISYLSEARVAGVNTVTGTAGEVKFGAAAAVTWAATLAAVQTDAVQLCVGGP